MTKEDLDGAHVGTGFQQMDGESDYFAGITYKNLTREKEAEKYR